MSMAVQWRNGNAYVYLADKAVIEANGGRKYRKALGPVTQAAAEVAERRIRESILSGVAQDSPMTLREAIDRIHREHYRLNKNGKNSLGVLNTVAEVLGEDTPLVSINKTHFNTLKAEALEAGRTGATVNRKAAHLRKLLNYAREEWALDTAVVRWKALPEKARERYLQPGEEEALLAWFERMSGTRKHATDARDLVVVLVDTGLRLEEALSLYGALPVNFSELHTYSQVLWEQRAVMSVANKGERKRTVPLTSRAMGVLLARRSRGLLFPNITSSEVSREWRIVRNKMGLGQDKQFTLHCLRHTCASRLVSAGVDLYRVKEWLGHSNIRVTEKYAHLAPDQLDAARNVLEGLVCPNIGTQPDRGRNHSALACEIVYPDQPPIVEAGPGIEPRYTDLQSAA
jgi:integrase